MIMKDDQKMQSRKKFLLWSATALSSIAALKLFKVPPKKNENTETVKMLDRNGKLVEVSVAALRGKKKKITNKELQNWIKKEKA